MPKLELGMISSTWVGTKIGIEEGIRKTKEIGFDTYDIFQDPLDIDDATRELIKRTCEDVGLPIRSCVLVAFGFVDFNPSVQRFARGLDGDHGILDMSYELSLLRERQRMVKQVTDIVDTFQKSTSWRITAPLRRLKTTLRRTPDP